LSVGIAFAVSASGNIVYRNFTTNLRGGFMKKIFAIVFSLSLTLSVVAFGNVALSAATKLSKPQVGYIKRKSKKVYYRTKNGTKYVAHKTKKTAKAAGRKTEHGSKKAYVKTKTTTKKTYSKSKDAITN